MLLSSTTDKLSLISEQTGDLDVVATFIDRNQSTGAVGVADRKFATITTVTTTDIVAAPASTTDRKVLEISIRNAHASTSMDVVVQYNDNGTLYEMIAARLYPTERLDWTEAGGWKKTGRRDSRLFERRMSEGDTRINAVVSGSDLNLSTVYNCFVNVPPTKAGGTVRVMCSLYLWHDLAAATTTGVGIGQVSPLIAGFTNSNNQNIQVCVDSVTAATLSAQDGGAADALVANGTSGLTNMMGIGGGVVKWTEAATPAERQHAFSLACQSEVAASQITIDIGAWFELFEATE